MKLKSPPTTNRLTREMARLNTIQGLPPGFAGYKDGACGDCNVESVGGVSPRICVSSGDKSKCFVRIIRKERTIREAEV
jgi:hypothetical protein